MKKKIAFITFVCFALFPGKSESQNPLRLFGKDSGLSGYINLGTSQIMVQNLNSAYEKNGIPAISDLFFSIGGGSRLTLKDKYVVGFDFTRLMRKRESNSEYFSTLSGSMNSVNLGYIVYKRKKVNVYPIIGIGTQNLDLKIYDDSNFSFDYVVSDPKMGSELSMWGLLLDIGVQLDLYSLKGKRKTYRMGIKAGYRMTVTGGYWSMAGQRVAGGPDAGIEGAYIQINLGVRDLMREIFDKKFDI
ncbi:hypothetical protein ACFL2X_05525 [Candidatus Latescibacterota bacterium]